MPINLADFTDDELIHRGIDPKLRKNFVQIPTLDELKPTPREMYYFELLRAWEESSKRSTIVLGVPPKYYKQY